MTRVERWERRVEVPLLLLALAFLVAYAWPVLDPRLDSTLRSGLSGISWAVWVVFVVDYVIRVGLAAGDRRSYIKRHWYDLPLIALPMLRPLRVLRVLAFARMVNRSATGGLVERASVYGAGAAVMSVGLGSVAMLDAEQNAPGANITSFGDALWWACSTVTTVGYGDRYPVTTEGRIIAVALMIVGISLLGAITASVATWMVSQVQRDRDNAG
ncbi:potassium channel family protein [Nocardioides cynanchi]|uniref:potassium channel family protein n=1 Tax=Nocardioides cynanchi TaxID=2558918 RepID=UPI0012460EE7|nr:potassium channel family protein [Nocardioides cynanchi]